MTLSLSVSLHAFYLKAAMHVEKQKEANKSIGFMITMLNFDNLPCERAGRINRV